MRQCRARTSCFPTEEEGSFVVNADHTLCLATRGLLADMKPSMHCSGHMCVHLLETSVFVHHTWLLPDNTVSSWSGFQHFVPLPLPAFSSLSQRSHARSSPSPALPNFRVKRIGTTGCYPAAMLTINSARVSLAVRIESSTHQVR